MSKYQSIRGHFDAVLPTVKGLVSDLFLTLRLNQRSSFDMRSELELPSHFNCFISTDKGVFHLKKGRLTRVFKAWTMGIAASSSTLYVASAGRSQSAASVVLAVDLDAVLNEGVSYNTRELYRLPSLNSRHRIHQVCLKDDHLWVANTGRNTLLQLNIRTGQIVQEIAPFVDRFGGPILFDNNHINSVSPCGETLLFAAYRAGNNSLIGVYGENTIRGYRYHNLGVHDIHISDHRLFFSDTFGRNKIGEGGALIVDGQVLDEDFFNKPPGYIVRGMAGSVSEFLLGHSHKGERSKRFDGNGSLLLIKNGRVIKSVSVPFSQVYDIIQVSGSTFAESAAVNTFTEVCNLLEGYLGKPIYEQSVTDSMLVHKR